VAGSAREADATMLKSSRAKPRVAAERLAMNVEGFSPAGPSHGHDARRPAGDEMLARLHIGFV